jgi:hypothetical protein
MKEHECFKHPDNKSVKIWRYMDFSKFVSLLETSALFLARVDKFDDPYEGARSHVNSDDEVRALLYQDVPLESLKKMSAAIASFMEWSRLWTYVNCWHVNEYESDAMWRLYARSNEAVAIQSTFEKLYSNVGSKAYIGLVDYIDYEKQWMPENNSFWPFVHKRKSFEHEKELRILIQNLPKTSGENPVFDYVKINNEFGRLLPVNLQYMIDSVYVAPTAPKWFHDAVAGVMKKYECAFLLRQSSLDKEPRY